MFSIDVCNLPETGGSTFVLIAGLFVLVAGVIVTHWVRQSAGRLSVVVAPLVLLGGYVLAPQVVDPCAPATTVPPATTTTTVAATTTVPSATTTTTVPSATTTVPSATTTVPSATTTTTSVVGAALTPTFGSTTATADGFTVQISNYDASFTWAGTATASGTVAVSGTGLVTVTGVAAGTSSTATITTTRTGYTGGTAQVTRTCASGGSCVVGDTGPGGGIIFYDAGSIQPWGRYLEAAPAWAEVEQSWATNTSNQTTAVAGADGTPIGTGAQNTIDIVAQAGNVAATSAAVYCSELVVGGQSDWFLPSKDELNLMYTNLRSASTPLGGFSTGFYWSSSESGVGTAWGQYFNSGVQFSNGKSGTSAVRPVRAF